MIEKKTLIIAWVASLVITVAASSYGYAYYQNYTRTRQFANQTGMSVDQVQQQFGQGGPNGLPGDANAQGFGGPGLPNNSNAPQGFPGAPGGTNSGSMSMNGKIDTIGDGTITLTTPMGARKISTDGASVLKTVSANISDIKEGQEVVIEGLRSTSGFKATSIVRLK